MSKQIGSPKTLVLTYLCQNLAFLILALSQQIVFLSISSVITGACVPGIVLLTAAELHRIMKTNLFPTAWSMATLIFACSQALGAMTMALWFQTIRTYQPIFLAVTLLLIPANFIALKSTRS
ncbi:MAG: YbfB/YjiJ family MFS transporter [Okeania sp. SIO3H1]|nr:YbfB/YjiJ family MFS transporter [Okeania sp. SIO3H1]